MTTPRTARDRLDRILSLVRRSTRFWAGAFALIVVGGLISGAVSFTRPLIYKSETVILYRDGGRPAVDEGGDPSRRLALKLRELIFTRAQLQRIIEELKLYPKTVEDRGYVDAVDELRSHVALRVKDGDTFGLSFEGEDPKVVQDVTARLASALTNDSPKNRSEQVEVSKEFLDAEKQRVETELKEKEANLARFLSKHPEFAREPAQGGVAALRAAAAKGAGKGPDATLLSLEREASRIQERLGMPAPVKKKKHREEVDPRLTQEHERAVAELQSAQKDLADKLGQFTEQHPDVTAAKVKVKTAEWRLKRANDALATGTVVKEEDSGEEEGIIDRSTLESELRKVQDEIATYKRKLASDATSASSAESQRLVGLETEWTRLNREANDARPRNQPLPARQEGGAGSGRGAQLTIVDPAYKPTQPSSASRTLVAAVGMLLSLGLGLGLALGCAMVDDRLYDRVDIEQLGLVPLLGVVPRAARAAKRKKGDLLG